MEEDKFEQLRQEIRGFSENFGYMEVLELLDVVMEGIADIIGEDYQEILRKHKESKRDYLTRFRAVCMKLISDMTFEELTEAFSIISLDILQNTPKSKGIEVKPTVH